MRRCRRDLLGRLQLPDHDNLVELVLADLKQKYSKAFGSGSYQSATA